VITIDQIAVVKKTYEIKPEARRQLGKPQLKYLEHAENNL
jgi:hypothetical protein